MFVGKELARLLAKFQALDEFLKELLPLADPNGKLHGLLQVRIVAPLPKRLVHRFHIAHRPEEDNLSRQLSLVLLQILFVFGVDPDRGPIDRPMT